MTLATLTDHERHAAAFAFADDLLGLARDLQTSCGDLMNAPLAETDIHAAEIVSYARMISNLVAPLDVLMTQGPPSTEEAS